MTKLVRALLALILLMATIANLGTDLKQGRGALLIVLAGLALAPPGLALVKRSVGHHQTEALLGPARPDGGDRTDRATDHADQRLS